MIKKLFSVPKTNYSKFEDQSKFKVIWRMGCFLSFTLPIHIIINLIWYPSYPLLAYIITFAIVLLGMLILKTTKKYNVVAKFVSSSITIILISTLFLEENLIHYETPMWVSMNLLFTFFVLGRRWGMISLVLSLTAIILYFGLYLEQNIQNFSLNPNLNVVNFTIEYIICGTGIAYFLHSFVGFYKQSLYDLSISNDKLKRDSYILYQQNKLISDQNKEKEMMLKEIHHRVKNNLQLIISLLKLQSHSEEIHTTDAGYGAAIRRIMTLSLVQKGMYDNILFDQQELYKFLHDFIKELYPEYNSPTNQSNISIKSQLEQINSKTLIPLTLILNELISLSINQEIGDGEIPKINIIIGPIKQNCFHLHYSDNLEKAVFTEHLFSLEIIDLMVEQLNGSLKRNFDGHKNNTVLNLELIKDTSLNQ